MAIRPLKHKQGKHGNESSNAPVTMFWLQQEFDKLHKSDAAILKRLDEIEELINPPNVIPELEEIINEVSARAIAIDRKVPDKSTPPSPHK